MARSTASVIGAILLTTCVTLTSCGSSPTAPAASSTPATTGTPTGASSPASLSTEAARPCRQRLGAGRGNEQPRRGGHHVPGLSPPAGRRSHPDPLTRLCLEHAGMLALAGPSRRGRSNRTSVTLAPTLALEHPR